MEDIFDQDGNISLFALSKWRGTSRDDQSGMSPEEISRLAKFRIEQMRCEMEANVAALNALKAKRS